MGNFKINLAPIFKFYLLFSLWKVFGNLNWNSDFCSSERMLQQIWSKKNFFGWFFSEKVVYLNRSRKNVFSFIRFRHYQKRILLTKTVKINPLPSSFVSKKEVRMFSYHSKIYTWHWCVLKITTFHPIRLRTFVILSYSWEDIWVAIVPTYDILFIIP